ncbi:hypothetical protein Pint_09896 [Pistacia integerrima]|uniref:Uncharacterized protein n=1 Tax=Pistacia integerrima TaxID=434235 RepID=A0ACC0XLL3_9ROSI|nr:hypothetical protein Pint_09896 [Pistacia integerrima]
MSSVCGAYLQVMGAVYFREGENYWLSCKKVTNKTKAVVNSTQISGAADRLRFITLSSNQISANAVAFSILLLISFICSPWWV